MPSPSVAAAFFVFALLFELEKIDQSVQLILLVADGRAAVQIGLCMKDEASPWRKVLYMRCLRLDAKSLCATDRAVGLCISSVSEGTCSKKPGSSTSVLTGGDKE